jgi:uncharacterized coiled-coil protein SlyX
VLVSRVSVRDVAATRSCPHANTSLVKSPSSHIFATTFHLAMSAHHEQDNDAGPRPYSIDLTLELERQLDNESMPNSPADAIGPHSLDPHVLASIITQLRTSLADVTRERDELSQAVTEQRVREAGAEDTMGHMMEKCSKMQEELDNARTKIKDDESTISILRTKVEESRFVSYINLRDVPLTVPL